VERTIVRGPAVWPRLEDGKHEVASQAATGQARMTVTTPSDPTVPRAEGPAAGTPTPDAAAKLQEPTGASPDRISLDDFMRVDLRVARVVAAERVPKSKKLVKMVVDIGPEQRTLVAGIAEAYDPERLVGRTVVVVATSGRRCSWASSPTAWCSREPRGGQTRAGRIRGPAGAWHAGAVTSHRRRRTR